jgi:hypothetical protein
MFVAVVAFVATARGLSGCSSDAMVVPAGEDSTDVVRDREG